MHRAKTKALIRSVDLRLSFRICRNRFPHDAPHTRKSILNILSLFLKVVKKNQSLVTVSVKMTLFDEM